MVTMIARFLRLALCALVLGQMVVTSFGADEARSNAPAWLSDVPVLSFAGQRAFQFRTRVGTPPQLTFYTSWAPPDHRAMVLCDPNDGLPLIYVVDGDGWVYDLVSGQIIHLKLEPKFNFGVDGGQVNFDWGAVPPGTDHSVQVDFVSFLKSPSIVSLKSSVEATGRVVAGVTAGASKALLETGLSDPPLPEKFVLSVPSSPVGQVECDAFHYNQALPPWHRSLDPAMLAKDVPYFDATDVKVKDISKEQAELVELAIQTLYGGATFLIRPALRDPATRAKVEERFSKIDFKQVEQHEKLLKDAWIRALQHQGCDPFKSFAPSPEKDAR
jgi:hypothetical protein